jgi:hypothetical protein
VVPDAHPSASPATTTGDAARPLTSCPQCRGAVRAGAPWCTQCWTDLRPPPAPAAPLVAAAPPTAATPAALPAPARGWPCATCGETNAVEADACAACGSGFLAALRGEDAPLLALPGVGDVGELSRGQRLGLALGFVLAVALLVLVVGLLAA